MTIDWNQGRQGQRFFARLPGAGVIEAARDGFDDDAAVAAGVGFTDVVKRPTPRADELSAPRALPDLASPSRRLIY
jgi:hypothetical protein